MRVVTSSKTVWVLIKKVVLLDLIEKNAVTINGWAKNEVCSLVFDLNVAVSLSLVKASRGSDPENTFPSCFPNKIMVELVLKLEA